jgi:hypothetical protein
MAKGVCKAIRHVQNVDVGHYDESFPFSGLRVNELLSERMSRILLNRPLIGFPSDCV